MTLIIRGVRVNITMKNITRLLHGSKFQLPTNIDKIDYRIEEMQKVKLKRICFEDKISHF